MLQFPLPSTVFVLSYVRDPIVCGANPGMLNGNNSSMYITIYFPPISSRRLTCILKSTTTTTIAKFFVIFFRFLLSLDDCRYERKDAQRKTDQCRTSSRNKAIRWGPTEQIKDASFLCCVAYVGVGCVNNNNNNKRINNKPPECRLFVKIYIKSGA